MHDFYGTVRLLDEPDAALDAKVTLDLNRVSIRAADAEIGSWPHADVLVKKEKDGLHLFADGETLLLSLENSDFFLDLLGVKEDPKPSRKRRANKAKPAPVVTDASPPDGYGDLRTKAAAIYLEDSKLNRWLAIGMAVAATFILIGAALNWGPFRLLDPGSFPIGRLLAGFGAFGGLVGLYFAYFDSNRITGSAIAIAAGVVTFVVMYFYTGAARLGNGFMLALLGSIGLIVAGTLGMSSHGGGMQEEEEKQVAGSDG
ncbi:MAG: hypothetical protein GY926_02595 [bacterium]|nr:hypothetical protein [bacterium]